ncbi:hypothetical protein NMY22_g13705 [Coprinellus aureogranulatus]|nr:hypothetical protein NMY22_g13705 [Coprinellus aureogranulatus]
MTVHADGATAYSESCPLPADPGSSPIAKNLLCLPEEILVLFSMELDFKSLVRFRVVGQGFEQDNPYSPGLAPPSPQSSDDIETDLQRWESGWGSPKRSNSSNAVALHLPAGDARAGRWSPLSCFLEADG